MVGHSGRKGNYYFFRLKKHSTTWKAEKKNNNIKPGIELSETLNQIEDESNCHREYKLLRKAPVVPHQIISYTL